MKTILLFFGFFALAGSCYSQVIKIDNGFSITNLNTKKADILHKDISSYSGFVGLEYLNKKCFYLSSEIGYLKIGGKETNEALDIPYHHISESMNYGQINTTFRVKANSPSNKTEFYAGAGPYINILLGADKFHSDLYEGYTLKRINVGCKTEAGITQNINKIRIGLNATYLINITPLATSPYTSFTYKAFAAFLSIGYKLN